MNTALVTTGLKPLIGGAVEVFQALPFLDRLPWLNITSAKVVFQDPTGALTHYSAAISGEAITLQWTVPETPGAWLRQWVFTDSNSVHQLSTPIVFNVLTALDPAVF